MEERSHFLQITLQAQSFVHSISRSKFVIVAVKIFKFKD